MSLRPRLRSASLLVLALVLTAHPAPPVQGQCIDYALYLGRGEMVDLNMGRTYEVVVREDLGFTAGLAFNILDLSDPAHPSRRSLLNVPGTNLDVAVVGDYAFLANESYDLHVVDVSDPDDPTLVGGLSLPGDGRALDAVDDLVCLVSRDDGLRTIDVSDPLHPQLLATLGAVGDAIDVALVGDVAYVMDNDYGLRCVDVSDPAIPAVVGDLPIGNPGEFVVAGGVAYCIDGAGVVTVDLADPALPTVLGTVATRNICRDLALVGDRVVVDASDYIEIIDVASPSAPALLGGVTCLIGSDTVFGAGSYGYLVSSDMAVFDLAHPTNPEPVAAHPTGDVFYLNLVADLFYATGNSTLILDVSDPLAPQTVNDIPYSIRDIAVEGDRGYGALGLAGLQIFDLADPAAPVALGHYVLPTAINGVATVGTVAYLCHDVSLRAMDVSDDWIPRTLSRLDFSDRTQAVRIVDGDACVALTDVLQGYGSGLAMVDVSDPLAMTVLGTLVTNESVSAMEVFGHLVFLLCEYDLWIIDVSDATNPRTLGVAPLLMRGSDVALDGRFAHVTCQNGGVQVFDVADPTDPVYVGAFDHDETIYAALAVDGTVYASNTYGGELWVVPSQCGALEPDCDLDGLNDALEIANHPSLDFNGDGILDACQQGQGISGAPDVAAAVLHAAQPNPFNPRTTLAFDLPRSGRATLRVYDLAGRLVRTLLDDAPARAGRNEAVWGGRDDAGVRVASGVYLYRLEADGVRLTRRMVLLK